MDTIFYAFAGLLFAAVIFLIEGIFMWWSSTRGAAAKRFERRMRVLSAGGHGGSEDVSILKQRHLSDSASIERFLLQIPRIHVFDRVLAQSGLDWSVSKFMTYSLSAFFATLLLCLLLNLSAFIVFGIGLLFLFTPLLIMLRARSKRMSQLEQQLPETADLMARALRAGHSFSSSLQMVRDEMPQPISGEFRIVFDEINYGVPTNHALMNLAHRVPLTDLRYLVIAVLIQRESGGNLAEILDKISYLIRGRLQLLGRIRVLSAEGKMSAWILGLLPFCLGLVIKVVNPKYMALLWTDPFGLKLVGYALTLMVIGVFWMRKIIKIRV